MRNRPRHHRITSKRVAQVLVTILLAAFCASLSAQPHTPGTWLGPDDQPLPFRTAESLLKFLTTAPVIETKELSGGINKPIRLTLERNGIRARAIFRSVDVSRTSNSSSI